eukprot:Skav233570  [mRNA]  locus=scaffold1972:24134:27388:+ [translate_table: standard]
MLNSRLPIPTFFGQVYWHQLAGRFYLETLVELSLAMFETFVGQVPWPCDSDVVSSFALQVINTADGNVNTAQIKRLDLDTGTYETLCNVVGVCLNACGIHPQTNLLYCNNIDTNNLVRVDCDLNTTDLELREQQGTLADAAVATGTVCYLGRLPGTFAANLDEKGEYWWDRGVLLWLKSNSGAQNRGDLFRITNGTLNSVETTGQTDPFTTGDRVTGAGDGEEVVRRPGLGNMADFNVVTRTFPQLTVTGDLTNVDPIVLTMRDIDPPPGQNNPRASGAQWLFNGTIYCAYNDGTLGGAVQF